MRLDQPSRAALANPTLVTSLAVAPDGSEVLAGQASEDGQPALSRWALPDLSPLDGPGGDLLGEDTCRVLVRDEAGRVALAGFSRQRLVLIAPDGTRTEPVPGDVVWAELGGGLLASSGTQTELYALDSAAPELLWRLDPPAPRLPNQPSLAPLISLGADRKSFTVGGTGDPEVRVYPIGGGPAEAVLTGAPERLRWLGQAPGSGYVLAIDADARSTVVWKAGAAGPHLPDIFGEEAQQYWSAAFHPDGEHVALGMLSGYVDIFRLPDGEITDSQSRHTGRVQALAFTPDGSLLLSGGDDGQLLAWPVR
ncbi:WD40 repeat domain-containing protein [Longispora albida]|uniref:WD40 repeat domain-containing protein n=1 Tax=Longispora albida TaxID=203523 RepID=UPI00036A198E|nr:WD40 repeat domain-containing protein [Longispora albida]